MEYIVSRKTLPENGNDFEKNIFYNLWAHKQDPYKNLFIADIIYWLSISERIIKWETEIIDIARFPYSDKTLLRNKLISEFNITDTDKKYFIDSPPKGYCLIYKIRTKSKLQISIEDKKRFPHLGWLKLDSVSKYEWLNSKDEIQDPLIDDLFEKNDTILEMIRKLNEKMLNLDQKRFKRIINSVIRNDGKLVKLLKKAANYKCQYPSCNSIVKMKNGINYVEVAHIEAVKNKGKSILGNLVVLCPNHHKEFDKGNLEITSQINNKIVGLLNKKKFIINLIN